MMGETLLAKGSPPNPLPKTFSVKRGKNDSCSTMSMKAKGSLSSFHVHRVQFIELFPEEDHKQLQNRLRESLQTEFFHHALGEERAVMVGHDWGAPVAWHRALLRADTFHSLVLLSVPFSQRASGGRRPTEAMRSMAGDLEFYVLYFQEPGKVEKELKADVRNTMVRFLYTFSGDLPPEKRWNFLFNKSQRFIDTANMPDTLPAWLTDHDIEVFTEEFKRSGFRGGVNWYRNIDRTWELTPFLNEAKIHQPSLFIAGQLDGVITMLRPAFDNLEKTIPNLKQKILIPGAGHWVQQERPQEVNKLMIEFLKGTA